ncbi:MAG: CPBP family intramembrane metalloprotease [Clostridia bacterium]|nr:CPBP family intramembrane metalloprotease [Clostridia bacterium]
MERGERNVAARTLSLLVVTLATYLLLWQLLARYVTLPVYYYGRLIELLGLLLFVALAVVTPMKFEKMGICTPPGVLLRSLAWGMGLGLSFVCALAGYTALRYGEVRFSLTLWGDISRTTYFLVAPFQEILAKSVMYYSFELVLEERHPHLANLMTALTFGAFHVVYGIRMMLLAMALSLVTGWVFQRERSVWGCAVAHFACGFFPACFGL